MRSVRCSGACPHGNQSSSPLAETGALDLGRPPRRGLRRPLRVATYIAAPSSPALSYAARLRASRSALGSTGQRLKQFRRHIRGQRPSANPTTSLGSRGARKTPRSQDAASLSANDCHRLLVSALGSRGARPPRSYFTTALALQRCRVGGSSLRPGTGCDRWLKSTQRLVLSTGAVLAAVPPQTLR